MVTNVGQSVNFDRIRNHKQHDTLQADTSLISALRDQTSHGFSAHGYNMSRKHSYRSLQVRIGPKLSDNDIGTWNLQTRS